MGEPNHPGSGVDVGVPQPLLPPGAAACPQPPPDTLVAAQAAATMAAARQPQRDPLSKHYKLPSSGLWYGGSSFDGTVYITPTRGEQEEVVAGIEEGPAAAAGLRHLVEQCLDTSGFPLDDLLLDDWAAVCLNLLSYSAGDDRVFMAPICPKPRGCGKASNQTKGLMEMDFIDLRLAGPGEESNWPPLKDEDPEITILREIAGETADGPRVGVLSAEQIAEPFAADPLKETGEHVLWRYLRVRDMTLAEDFAQRMAEESTKPGSKLGNLLTALSIVSINGKKMGLIPAYQWVKRTPSKILRDLRRQIERRSFGFNMRPRFKCPKCGHSFRVDLPLDASLFQGDAA